MRTMRSGSLRVLALAVLLAACSTMAACAAPTAPRSAKPHFDTITCRSGYAIAQRADGSYYCAPL